MIQIQDVNVGYAGTPVLDGVSIEIDAGETLGVIGPNGCGKSTLLKTIARQLRPSVGAIHLDGRELMGFRPKDLARQLSMLPQTPTSPPELTVDELVGYGRTPHVAWHRRLSRADRDAIDRAIRACRLGDLVDRRLATLSGGERQRAWLALALAQAPRVLLLDEPITFLDVHHQLEVMDLVGDLNRDREITVVMVMHDINLAARYCDRLIALKAGRIHADGPPATVLTADVLREVFSVDADVSVDRATGCPHCIFRRSLDARETSDQPSSEQEA